MLGSKPIEFGKNRDIKRASERTPRLAVRGGVPAFDFLALRGPLRPVSPRIPAAPKPAHNLTSRRLCRRRRPSLARFDVALRSEFRSVSRLTTRRRRRNNISPGQTSLAGARRVSPRVPAREYPRPRAKDRCHRWSIEAETGLGPLRSRHAANCSRTFPLDRILQSTMNPGWRGFAADPGLICVTPSA